MGENIVIMRSTGTFCFTKTLIADISKTSAFNREDCCSGILTKTLQASVVKDL